MVESAWTKMTSVYFFCGNSGGTGFQQQSGAGNQLCLWAFTLVPNAESIVIESIEIEEADMQPRRSNTVLILIALLVALAGLPAFDVWSMGSAKSHRSGCRQRIFA